MNVINGNILSTEVLQTYDAICVTTNGVRKRNGEAVMGAGVAKAFASKWPQLPGRLGERLANGNVVHPLHCHWEKVGATHLNKILIMSFPTKDDWREDSKLPLIITSAKRLVEYADMLSWRKVALPPPGVGMGNLRWQEVQEAIENILDDRFTVIFLERNK